MALKQFDGASLRALNSFGIDARAERLLVLDDAADVDDAIDALARSRRTLVLGGGSNVVFAEDFDGTVLQMAMRGRSLVGRLADGAVVEAAAGESWHEFVGWTLEQGLSGLENLSLIPGTVGASPIQNIGAYGVEMRDRFESLLAIDRRDGRRSWLGSTDCRFGYRDSIFKHDSGAHWMILSVRFRLSSHFRAELDYGELRQEIATRRASGIASAGSGIAPGADVSGLATADPNAAPSALEVAAAVAAIRRRKLPDPRRLGNAGSFFRNPIVPTSVADALCRRYPQLPCYPADASGGEVRTKLSAAWMIEQCGWKGHRDGDAGVHERHALVLVNHGTASGAQILALGARIVDSVDERFGVRLEPEPVIVRARHT